MGGFAWVTLATNDSYSLGALVLAHSLKRVGTKYDLAVLVTPGVTAPMREKLASVFSLVQEVNVLDSKDEANLALLARPELGITFTKLHCWRLTQYEKCVFVDADTLVIRNCDELFEREELSAAPDVGWPDCFNSGVFVFTPSQQTFASITSFAAAKGSFDGGDQGLLNQYFSDWSHKDISKHLPFIYNMCSTATYSYLPAFKQFGDDVRIIHFIGITKPWLQYFDTLTGQVQPAPGSNHLQPLLQLWWNIFCENVHSQLSPVMASSTLASVWHELNLLPSVHSFPRTSYQDVADFTYDVTESKEPDFSEFQDPWDNYTEQSYFPISAVEVPSENYYDSSYYHSSRNDSLEQTSAPIFHWESSEKHDEYKQPLVLDSRQNNERHDTHETATEQKIHEIATVHSHDHHHYKEINNQTQKPCWIHDDNHKIIHHHENQVKHNLEQKYQNNHHHEQDNRSAEQVNHISQQVFRHDEQNNIVHEKQEHRHHDHSFESEQYHRDDNFRHEKQENHQYYHDHRDEAHASSQNFTDDRRESTINQSNVINEENKRQNEQDRLQVHSNIDRHEKQTDVCKTKYHSPPEPCTKSKSIATQSEPNIAGQLESNDAGIAGALAKITLGEARSPEQVAFEEHMRKQSWEQGQIDYMGRDSFENIWKKISETLAVQPQRQPSPPKIVAKPEKTETTVVPPVATTEAEPEAKSEAAVLPEIRQKEEQDLISELAPALSKLSSPHAGLTCEEKIAVTVSPQSSISNAAVTTVALMQTVPQQSPMESIEAPLSQKTDSDKSIITAATTTTTVSLIPQTSANLPQDVKIEQHTAKSDFPETPAAASIVSQASKALESTTSEVVPESPVPIQVAESVLEAEVKESVTEDLKPVTEEAISSISESSQEPVPAILETTMQAVEAVDSSTGLETGIGNDLDALSSSSPSRVTSSVSAEVIPEVVAPLQTQEVISSGQGEEACPLPVRPVESLPEAIPLEKKEGTCPLPVRPVESLPEAIPSEKKEEESPLPVRPVESLPEAIPSEKKEETCSLPIRPVESFPQATPLEKREETCPIPVRPVESLPEATPLKKKEETCSLPVKPVDKNQCSLPIVEPLAKSAETEQKKEKPEEVKLPAEAVQPSTKPSEEPSAESKQPTALPVELETLQVGSNVTKTEETKAVDKSAETKLPVTEEPSLPTVETTSLPKPKLTVCPMKPGRKNPEIELPIDTQESKTVPADETNVTSEETTSQSESSEESPIRPARTKDIQIPGTPIVIAATPPTSPPIGAVENFEDQPTKVTKKIVKKVVKKTTTGESKTADGAEGDADGKKVTKKVVKKVVKKTKEDDPAAAESSSGSEKPKKIVKVVKKTTKSSQSLETDTTVPETPPPGISEIPVPPKRKLKTTAKTIPAKTDSEP